MRANVAVKVIDKSTGKPIEGANVVLGTSIYSLNGTTDSKGSLTFVIDVGGGEAGRHPEEGVALLLTVTKNGYEMERDRFICYGNQAIVFRMERM
jgi:hypothetical protein